MAIIEQGQCAPETVDTARLLAQIEFFILGMKASGNHTFGEVHLIALRNARDSIRSK